MTKDFERQSSDRNGYRVDLESLGLSEEHISNLRSQMNEYRMGHPLPVDYIKIHRACAYKYMDQFLSEYDFSLISAGEVTDGWLDGMKVLRLICEDTRGNLRDIRWSDANGGSWFEKLPSGGKVLIHKVGIPGHL